MKTINKICLLSVLIFSPIQVLAFPFSAPVQKNIDYYESNPKYINMLCGGMRQINRQNKLSVFSSQVTKLQKQQWRFSTKEYDDFVGYITSNYCNDVF